MKRKRPEKIPPETAGAIDATGPESGVARWKAMTLTGFRFVFVYLGLYILATQISGSLIPNLSFYYRGMGRLWPMRDITWWMTSNVFGVTTTDGPIGNGEPVFVWVQSLWIFIAALLAAALWSALDRRRENYVALHKWFRLFIRFALAGAMFEYGLTKLIPTQFPPPSLETLVTPVGDLTLSRLLWTSIGASPPYEMFTGCVEILGGLLLLVPRTTMLGALVSFAAMTQVFVLNMTYDIGLKLVSFHLIVLAIFLITPDARRLWDFFLRNRAVEASSATPLFQTPSANRIALVAQLAFGIYMVGIYAYLNWSFWQGAGGGSPRSALYGIWNVEELAVDGQIRAPYLNDYDRRWRRVVFDEPSKVTFQRTDDSFARYGASIDPYGKTIALTTGNSKTWKAGFRFERPAEDRLTLEGEMDGLRIRAQLRLLEFDTLRVLNSNFRWVRPHEP